MNEKVKQAVETIRELDLYDLHSEDFDNILGALNNLEELIKGKDEYIAKLCNDRAEKSSALRIQENNNIRLVESNLHLMEENKELKEFAREIAKLPRFLETNYIKDNNYKIRNSKYNENERCWLYQDVRCSTDDKNGWFLNERDGAMLFSKESAEKTIQKFKDWGFEGAEDLIIVLEYKQSHDRYLLFKKVVEKYGKS